MKHSLLLFLSLSLVAVAAPPAPKLIVYISIDQMRPDYLERYGPLMSGGLKMLYDRGIVYRDADLNYATSETGPGHASLGTGCYPRQSGIHGNEWIDPVTRKNVYCVEDSLAGPVDGVGGGFSPRNLMVPAIGDWLKKASPASKVITLSAKDRAAILMGGWKTDGTYWYSKKTGGMVTSDYYMSTMPAWVKEFNASEWTGTHVPDVWDRLLPEERYTGFGPDSVIGEQAWNGSIVFPHRFAPGKKADQVMGTPYGDAFLLDFAIAAVKAEQLGKRGAPDILCVSLSNCDYVGHGFGPDSHEIIDLLVRLDRSLATFFARLDSTVGPRNYAVALSADHAVCPLPEFSSAFRGIAAKRYIYPTDIQPKLDSLSSLLKYKTNSSDDIIIMNSFINYAAASRDGWDTVKIQQEIAKGLLSIDAFVDVYFRHEMIGTGPTRHTALDLFRNSYYAPRGEDFQYRVRENCIISSRPYGTTHGSPYRYDTHVPLLFWWNGIRPQRVTRRVHSVDAAPTLATMLRIPLPKNLDGKPLVEVTR